MGTINIEEGLLMDISKNIVIELVGTNDKDKEILIDYFEDKEIGDLFIEYDALEIGYTTKKQIENLKVIIESWQE